MSLILRRNILLGQGGEPPTPPPGPIIQRNYLVYGNPTISGTSYIPDTEQNGFIYTDVPFSPGANSWVIQTKIKVTSLTSAWRTFFESVDHLGDAQKAIIVQNGTSNSNRQLRLYLSNNGSSWNIGSGVCTVVLPLNEWLKYQLVCTYSNGSYEFKQGFPDTNTWSGTKSTTTPPTYGNHIAFLKGGTGINVEVDLSETKIIANGTTVWEAITIIEE